MLPKPIPTDWTGFICHALYAALLATTETKSGQTCILQILLHGADTWTLLADDTHRLQSFHMGCQRQLLGVKWQDHIKNTDIADMTSLPNIADIISKRHHTLFGHVVRLDATTHAHQALGQVIAMKAGYCPGTNWHRPLDILERHGRSARELHPAGGKCGRAQRNVDIVESHCNVPQLSTCHDDDDDITAYCLLLLLLRGGQ